MWQVHPRGGVSDSRKSPSLVRVPSPFADGTAAIVLVVAAATLCVGGVLDESESDITIGDRTFSTLDRMYTLLTLLTHLLLLNAYLFTPSCY